MKQSKQLLIIGKGFVGSELERLALGEGWDMISVTRSGRNGSLQANVSELDSVRDLSKKIQPSHIVHCASASGGGLEGYKSVYLRGSENLASVFPEARLLFTSSTSVYGQSDGSIVDEDSETTPSSETARVLLETEQVVLNSEGIVLRLSGLYGEGRSYLLKKLFAGEAQIEADGKRWVNYIHHTDAARACLFLLEHGEDAEIYNGCNSHPVAQRELYTSLCEMFDLPIPPSSEGRIVSKRGWSDKAVSNKKLINLGWKPKYPRFVDAAQEVAKSLNLIS